MRYDYKFRGIASRFYNIQENLDRRNYGLVCVELNALKTCFNELWKALSEDKDLKK